MEVTNAAQQLPDDDAGLMTVEEVCALARCAVRTVYNNVRAGKLEVARRAVGRRLLFRRSAVLRWMGLEG